MKNLIYSDSKIFDVLKLMNHSGKKTLFVINKNKKYLGSITDGDIRRYLVNNNNFDSPISKIYKKKSVYIYERDIINTDIKKIFLLNNIDLIPILNTTNNIVDQISIRDVLKNKKKISSIPLVIMAGGKGIRMKPLTNFIPKPLIPVNGKPMIENIFELFSSNGLDKFYVSVNKKDSVIKKFLKYNPKYNINFLEETNYLGTIGAVQNKKLNDYENFFVINCDILIDIDCQHILDDHLLSKKILTIVLVKKIKNSPYGLCKVHNKNLIEINEKPEEIEYISSGFYILNKDVLKYIKKNTFTDMDQLINTLLKNKIKINTYSISSDKWKDIGKFKNYIDYISSN